MRSEKPGGTHMTHRSNKRLSDYQHFLNVAPDLNVQGIRSSRSRKTPVVHHTADPIPSGSVSKSKSPTINVRSLPRCSFKNRGFLSDTS